MTRSSPESVDPLDVTEEDRAFAEHILLDFGSFEEGIEDQEKLAEWVRNIRNAAYRDFAQTPAARPWHEALADRVLRLKIGGANNLSCDAVLGLIAFVRDGEGSVPDTSTDRPAQPQTPSDIVQHVAWLNQYIIGMDENNWKDMRLRAERQLEGLSVALSISRPVRNPE